MLRNLLIYIKNYLKRTDKAGVKRHISRVIFDHLVIYDPDLGDLRRGNGLHGG